MSTYLHVCVCVCVCVCMFVCHGVCACVCTHMCMHASVVNAPQKCALKTIVIWNLKGVDIGHAPLGKYGIFDLYRCFWGFLTVVLRLLFIVYTIIE